MVLGTSTNAPAPSNATIDGSRATRGMQHEPDDHPGQHEQTAHKQARAVIAAAARRSARSAAQPGAAVKLRRNIIVHKPRKAISITATIGREMDQEVVESPARLAMTSGSRPLRDDFHGPAARGVRRTLRDVGGPGRPIPLHP